MTYLLSSRVGNLLSVHPICGLRVLRVVNLLSRVERGGEVLKEVALVEALAIETNIVSIIGTERARCQTL